MQKMVNAPFVDLNAQTAKMLLNVLVVQKDSSCRVQFARKLVKMDSSIINLFARHAHQVAQNVQPLITAHNVLIIICLRVRSASQDA